jgi:hypothetical protein
MEKRQSVSCTVIRSAVLTLSFILAASSAVATEVGKWVKASPTTAGFIGGYVDSTEPDMQGHYDLPVCRASYQGGVHPGKVWRGLCHFEWGGQELRVSDYEELVNVPANSVSWVKPVNYPYPNNPYYVDAQTPNNTVNAGAQDGIAIPICHAAYNNGVHPGKWWKGKCLIGWGGEGHMIDAKDSEVLVSTQ